MLVEVAELVAVPGGPVLAQVRTAHGPAVVRWRGEPAAVPGAHHVEWTVDAPVRWGHELRYAGAAGPLVRAVGHRVVLRGRWEAEQDGIGTLRLGGALILLECEPPVDVDGRWVELCLAREDVELCPYQI
ncbi:hypothetical protein ACFW1A_32055 [Kitasatospora sp. NPDC058965]|uniref:hypothetical protein n=1 Tax=Kitasatospora sp. NPDC058965 TaxID=3346682 RepID=UPI0036AAF06C